MGGCSVGMGGVVWGGRCCVGREVWGGDGRCGVGVEDVVWGWEVWCGDGRCVVGMGGCSVRRKVCGVVWMREVK